MTQQIDIFSEDFVPSGQVESGHRFGIRADFAGIRDREGGRNITHPRVLHEELNDDFDEFEDWRFDDCFSWEVIGVDSAQEA